MIAETSSNGCGKNRIDRQDKYLDAMVGSALGDAIGELAFRYPEKSDLLQRVDQLGELRYTDDTAMAIGLAESIIEKGSSRSRNPDWKSPSAVLGSRSLFCSSSCCKLSVNEFF